MIDPLTKWPSVMMWAVSKNPHQMYEGGSLWEKGKLENEREKEKDFQRR